MEDVRRASYYQGIWFKELFEVSTDAEGNTRKHIPTNQGIAFPLGTTSTFRIPYAPATYMEAANTMGQPYYAKSRTLEFNKGVELEAQSNPLPMCHRPDLLVELVTT